MRSDEPTSSTRLAVTLRRGVVATLWLSFVAVGTGCGGSLYALHATQASAKLEEARAMGADVHAPYEYHFADEHLTKAQEEAAEAEYGDAVEFASVAKEFAQKAIERTREARAAEGAKGPDNIDTSAPAESGPSASSGGTSW